MSAGTFSRHLCALEPARLRGTARKPVTAVSMALTPLFKLASWKASACHWNLFRERFVIFRSTASCKDTKKSVAWFENVQTVDERASPHQVRQSCCRSDSKGETQPKFPGQCKGSAAGGSTT